MACGYDNAPVRYRALAPRIEPRALRDALRVMRSNSLGDGLRFAAASHFDDCVRRQWLPFLDAFAVANHLPEPSVDLLMKPLNQYMIWNLPIVERVRLLCTHYSLLVALASPDLVGKLWRGGGVELGTVNGKSGRYAIWLCDTGMLRTRKEGEITIALRQAEDGQEIAKLTFILTGTQDGRRGLMIGGLQGPRLESAKALIVSATRDLYGLRPRDAVLAAALGIANRIGARDAWAVSSSLHVHNAREARQRKRLFVDYDDIWIERGARRTWPFGWAFHVPPAPVHSGKTSLGRRRDAVKETIWTIAQSAFAAPPPDAMRHAANGW